MPLRRVTTPNGGITSKKRGFVNQEGMSITNTRLCRGAAYLNESLQLTGGPWKRRFAAQRMYPPAAELERYAEKKDAAI